MERKNISIAEYHGLAKNSVWLMVSNLSMVFVLVLTILASRLLGDTVFGQYVFLLALSTLLSEICVLGTTDYAGILVAREPERMSSIVSNTLGLRIPFGIAYMLLCLLAARIFMPEALVAALLIASDWVVRTVIHFLRIVLRARDVFRLDAIVSTVERLAVLVGAGAGLFLGRSLVAFSLGFLAGRLVGLLACFKAYGRIGGRAGIGFDFDLWRGIIGGGYPIGIRTLLKGISFRIDAVMIGLLRTSAEVGWYGAAYKFLEASFFFQEAVGASFLPAIARSFGQKRLSAVRDLYGRGYKILFIIGGITAGAGFIYAERIVALVFGSEYAPAAPVLRILVFAMLMVFGSMTSISLIDAVGLQHRSVGVFVASLILNVTLNMFLIPRLGIMGAAWGTLLTQAFLAAALLRLSFRSGYAFPVAWLYGPLAACASFTLVCLAAPPLPSVLEPVLGMAAFAGVLMVFRVFDETDIGYARMLLFGLIGRGTGTAKG
jgi:O-antigen/teichoic acid export membrane protein